MLSCGTACGSHDIEGEARKRNVELRAAGGDKKLFWLLETHIHNNEEHQRMKEKKVAKLATSNGANCARRRFEGAKATWENDKKHFFYLRISLFVRGRAKLLMTLFCSSAAKAEQHKHPENAKHAGWLRRKFITVIPF